MLDCSSGVLYTSLETAPADGSSDFPWTFVFPESCDPPLHFSLAVFSAGFPEAPGPKGIVERSRALKREVSHITAFWAVRETSLRRVDVAVLQITPPTPFPTKPPTFVFIPGGPGAT